MSALPDEVLVAARNGDLERVSAWLDAGGDIHAVDRLHESETLLIAATTTRRADLARYLLSRGVNVNQAFSGRGSGKTALHEACLPEIASMHVASLLLAAGANVNATTHRGWTPLGISVYREGTSTEIAALLLRAGASLDNCCRNDSAEDVMREREARRPSLAGDEKWNAVKAMIAGVRAHGSWKAYKRAPHREVLRLRSLVARQRALAIFRDDASYDRPARVAAFLCRRGGPTRPDNGVVWNILSYWNATE